ncbi:MAG: DarT ssDNA thymidine ADP-ribosyltransferase family protein [Thermoplasmataceae archaeon]
MKRGAHEPQFDLYKGAEPGQPRPYKYRYLYYITHIDNISSILKNGILSHERIINEKIEFTPVYNKEIVNKKKEKKTSDGISLWHYANFYLQPRNAMMYQVKKLLGTDNIAVLACFRGPAYEIEGALITDGNAASNDSNFYSISEHNKVFNLISDVDGLEYWKEEDGTKRRIMAEVLVPNRYIPEHIHSVLVSNQKTKEHLESLINPSGKELKVIIDPRTFFELDYEIPLSEYLTLVKGDMFFSGLQTLTVSVNTKGVMGKGLASRAKYQFPDIYVYYQDACKSKKLKLGHPVIYKRETALDLQLADNLSQIDEPNNRTWFLLFATKDDWKQPANKEGIIKGLEWLLENYKAEGIKSLAIPALGCGLGWLDWSEIGPLLCRYLSKMTIQVQLFVPAEREIPPEQLSKSFLLPDTN